MKLNIYNRFYVRERLHQILLLFGCSDLTWLSCWQNFRFFCTHAVSQAPSLGCRLWTCRQALSTCRHAKLPLSPASCTKLTVFRFFWVWQKILLTQAKDFTIIAIRRSSTRNELSDCIHQFWTRANQDELSELLWFFGYGNKRLQICSDELSSFRFKGVWGFFFSRNRILWFQSSSKDSLTRERVCDVRQSCYRLRVSAQGAFLYCGKQNCADIRLKDEWLRSVLFLSVLFRLYEHSSTAEGRIVKFMNSRMKSCASRYVRKNFQCMYVSLSLYVCVCPLLSMWCMFHKE